MNRELLFNNLINIFWDFYVNTLGLDQNKIFFDSNQLDFSNTEFDYYVLVKPQFLAPERASIGETYNSRSNVLFLVKIYTNLQQGEFYHQDFISKLLRFFEERKSNQGFKTTDPLVIGPTLDLELKNYLLTNLSSEYKVDTQKTLT